MACAPFLLVTIRLYHSPDLWVSLSWVLCRFGQLQTLESRPAPPVTFVCELFWLERDKTVKRIPG